jgi:raffinose/stachyose/melibiose transport system permease protein
VFFLPYILPMTIVAIMWANALDPNYGWISGVLKAINPQWSNGLLANPQTAMWVVCLVAIWQFAGFPMVLVLGGLSAIPRDTIEAARLDGTNSAQLAWYVSLPLSKDVISTVTLLQLIFSFKVFDIVQALTRGGPGTSTQVIGTLIFRDAFVKGNYGYASAIAVVASVLIVAISLVYLAILKPGKIEKSG